MSRVVVADSSYGTCREAVERSFEAFPLAVAGRKVAVKVNALKAGDPDRHAYVTHHRLLKAVVEGLESLGAAQIVVGDSVGTEYYGRSEEVFRATRLQEAAGPCYRNFSRNLKVVDLQLPFPRKVAVLKDVLDADLYISLPKLKTHGLTMLSGSVKNNFGLMAGAQKSWYHYFSLKPEVFAGIVVEMFRLRPPDLVIMDAIMAMEGYGPASPECRWVGKVLASDDAVALDTVAASIVGFGVEDVPYLRLAREQRLGETDLRAIQIQGDASVIADYHRPAPPQASYSYRAGVGSGKTSIEYYRQRVSYRPVIAADSCRHREGCTACVEVCPFAALHPGETIPEADIARCMLCSACQEVCEWGALSFDPDRRLMEWLAGEAVPTLERERVFFAGRPSSPETP